MRTGEKPQDALALAEKIVACPSLCLCGVQAYAGHVQHIHPYDIRKQTSLQCLQDAVHIFRKLKATVSTCTIFSASGTGTFDIDITVPEISDHQVGSYVCMDTEYLEIGSADNHDRFTSFEPALRLLTTVVSDNHDDFVTVDAGMKTLYKDGGSPQVMVPDNLSLEYDWFGDEYGKITSADNAKLPSLGSVLELVSSHCDPTVNLFDKFYLIRGKEVVGTWPIDLRGHDQ
ncbi:hypothetical protein ACLKMH_08505 [Psychromonas sp. KJ10-10]|uniref:hypothetical protein n=1 Tax=Psychromonas sp. KJ10-10 TaxID=3391823 RepID=UPI0039B606FE